MDHVRNVDDILASLSDHEDNNDIQGDVHAILQANDDDDIDDENILLSNTTIETPAGNREIVAPLSEIRSYIRSRESTNSFAANISNKFEHEEKQKYQFAQMVALDTQEIISKQLEENSRYAENGPGLPTSLAVQSKYIAIGTSRGLVLIFDHFQQIVRVLCLGRSFETLQQALRHVVASGSAIGAVCSMDCVIADVTKNEMLGIGYARGSIEIWDIARGSLLRVIPNGPNNHTHQISLIKFISTGKAFSGDTTKRPFASLVSVDNAGTVYMHLLNRTLMIYSCETKCLLDGGAGPIVSIAASEAFNMVALCSRSDTYLVSLNNNTAKIVYKWPIDTTLLNEVTTNAKISWGYVKMFESAPSWVLARAVGSGLEFLCSTQQGNQITHKTVEGVHENVEESIVALEWLNDHLLAFLQGNHQLTIFDTTGMVVVEHTNVENVQMVWTSLGSDILTHENAVRTNGTNLFLLGMRQLSVCAVQTWSKRMETLIAHNGWMEALALALEHFEISRNASLGTKMSDYILRFLSTNVPNVSDTGVAACIEYCVQINNMELLFNACYGILRECGQQHVFLRLLEPYIINRLITRVSPEVLQDFVDDFVQNNNTAELQTCILHLEPETIRTDLHTLVKVCKEHKLYDGLVYLYNTGLNDYDTPATLLLEVANMTKLLQYLEYSVNGLSFPFRHELGDTVTVSFVRAAIIEFVLNNMKNITKSLLVGGYDDITPIAKILEIGLGTESDPWELKVIETLKRFDMDEACRICAHRLMMHSVNGLSDKSFIAYMFQYIISKNDEKMLVQVLEHIDPQLYDVSLLTDQTRGLGWHEALSTLHENALKSAIKDGQNMGRIQTVFEQVIKVSVNPVEFVSRHLKQHKGSLIIHQALQNAVKANLQYLTTNDNDLPLVSEIISQMIRDPQDLSDYPKLQYFYLKQQYAEAESDVSVRAITNAGLINAFLESMCQFEPSNVMEFLSEHEASYSVDDAIVICRKFNIYDAVAYLLEKDGNLKGALEVTLIRLHENALDFPSQQHIVAHAVALCERDSLMCLDASSTGELWFVLLDDIMSLAVENPKTNDGHDAESALLRQLMNAMMVHVDLQTILSSLQSKNIGQSRRVIQCMIDARVYELNIMRTARELAVRDLLDLVQERYDSLGRGRYMNTLENKLPADTKAHSLRRRFGRARIRAQGWEEQMDSLMPRPLVLDPM